MSLTVGKNRPGRRWESEKMKTWRVKYQDIRALRAGMPFFNLKEIVEAGSRVEAIEKVKDRWNHFGHYGNYKASIVK